MTTERRAIVGHIGHCRCPLYLSSESRSSPSGGAVFSPAKVVPDDHWSMSVTSAVAHNGRKCRRDDRSRILRLVSIHLVRSPNPPNAFTTCCLFASQITLEGEAMFRRETGAIETEKVVEAHEVNATTTQFQVSRQRSRQSWPAMAHSMRLRFHANSDPFVTKPNHWSLFVHLSVQVAVKPHTNYTVRVCTINRAGCGSLSDLSGRSNCSSPPIGTKESLWRKVNAVQENENSSIRDDIIKLLLTI